MSKKAYVCVCFLVVLRIEPSTRSLYLLSQYYTTEIHRTEFINAKHKKCYLYNLQYHNK